MDCILCTGEGTGDEGSGGLVQSSSVRRSATLWTVGGLVKGGGHGLSKHAAGELIIDDLNARSADNEPCNVLDLSSFPPTTIANSG